MLKKAALYFLLSTVAISIIPVPSNAFELFDDFEDGSHLDGSPATWLGENAEVLDGILVLSGQQSQIQPTNETSKLWSMRAAVRHSNSSQSAGLLVNNNYWALLKANGQLSVGQSDATTASVALDYSPLSIDSFLQIDAVGDELRAWAWPVGTPKPEEPLVGPFDDRFPGNPVLWTFSEGLFLDVAVSSTSSIPEPNSSTILIGGLLSLANLRRRLAAGRR